MRLPKDSRPFVCVYDNCPCCQSPLDKMHWPVCNYNSKQLKFSNTNFLNVCTRRKRSDSVIKLKNGLNKQFWQYCLNVPKNIQRYLSNMELLIYPINDYLP